MRKSSHAVRRPMLRIPLLRHDADYDCDDEDSTKAFQCEAKANTRNILTMENQSFNSKTLAGRNQRRCVPKCRDGSKGRNKEGTPITISCNPTNPKNQK